MKTITRVCDLESADLVRDTGKPPRVFIGPEFPPHFLNSNKKHSRQMTADLLLSGSGMSVKTDESAEKGLIYLYPCPSEAKVVC